jgi:multisubunit Na+/H+ antiporter MnhC subunit
VLLSFVPIVLGPAVAIALVVYLVVGLGQVIDTQALRILTGCLLLTWGVYCLLYGHRHRVSIGLRTGYIGLGIWSFLMATAHGAGLMLIPALMPLQEHADHMHAMPLIDSMWIAALAVAVHTVAMLAVSGAIALIVYDFVGLGILRRGWINLDLVWAAALIAMGLFLLLTELPGVPGY